jgi:hypothetical protein
MNNGTPSSFLGKVQFHAGERLTPEVLNSLSASANDRMQLLSQLFVGTPGVIAGYLGGLSVTIQEDVPLTLKVESGVAVNNQGEFIVLDDASLVSLKGITIQEDTLLFLEIVANEIVSVMDSGHKITKPIGRIVVTKNRSDSGVEVGRVRISHKSTSIKSVLEETGLDTPPDTLDLRYVNRIQMPSRNTIEFENLYVIRKNLMDLNSAVTQIEWSNEEAKRISEVKYSVLLLRAMVSESSFSRSMATFIMGQLSHSLMDVLEGLREDEKTRGGHTQDFWPETLGLCGLMQEQSAREFNVAYFKTLGLLIKSLRENVLKATIEKERVTLIKDDLDALRKVYFSYLEDHALGGVLFRLENNWDYLTLKDQAKATVQYDTQKSLTSQFPDGTTFRGQGRFYSEGRIVLNVDIADLRGDFLLFLQIYKRRGVKEFQLAINGNTFHKESMGAADLVDKVVNIGCFIPNSFMKVGANELLLDIKRVDFDFGLMGIWMYQSDSPAEQEGSRK